MSLCVKVKKSFPGFCLEADFACDAGMFALLGASGSGKTLTLNCVAGVQKPDEGHIELDGKVLFDSKGRINLSPQERGIGLLFQSYALFPNMTAEQNIRCGLARIQNRHEKETHLRGLIASLHLQGLEKHYPHQLSGGQQQRVALARVLGSEPKLLMLDEPFSALDEALKWELEQELFEMLSGFQAPVLYITHDMREVRRLCEQVCVLDHGKTQGVMTAQELLNHPKTKAAALLCGFENVTDVVQTGEKLVFAKAWQTALQLSAAPSKQVRSAAIHADTIEISPLPSAKKPNAIACQILRIVEETNRRVYICRPEGARGHILVAKPCDAPQLLQTGERCELCLIPENIRVLS
ncbi:MAG: ATP-binding cassette domain-containing protein [Clostridia bacterium]